MVRVRSNSLRAFTLIELMVVLAIIAVIATMVMPMVRNDDRLRLIAAATLLSSDIEFAQAMSISDPARPMGVKLDADTESYHVAFMSDLDTPITRSDTGELYAVTLGHGRATAAAGVNLSFVNVDKNVLQFDTHGGLREINATPVITLQAGNDWIQLTISPATGTITDSSGKGTPP